MVSVLHGISFPMSRFECAVPPKILEENFPTGLVLISNQAQSQKEAAKCVLWIVHFLFFGKYTLLSPCHIAQLADEISVGATRFRGECSVKPCESNPLLCQRIVCLLDVKSCFDEIPFAFEQGIQICECSVGEVFPRQCRKLFMVPQGRMTDKQRTMVAELSKQYKKTGRAFRIVKSLDDFYASTFMVEAQERLDKLCSWMRRCRLKPMKDAALTLRNHSKEILNYFHTRLTNAICKGINAMIQAAKRKARGFHTFEGYAAMIYLVAGKLKLDTSVLF